MTTVNMLEAKNTLSRLVEWVASGQELEITIARHGRPAARLVPVRPGGGARVRLGVARGRFAVPASIDESAAEAAALFQGMTALTDATAA